MLMTFFTIRFFSKTSEGKKARRALILNEALVALALMDEDIAAEAKIVASRSEWNEWTLVRRSALTASAIRSYQRQERESVRGVRAMLVGGPSKRIEGRGDLEAAVVGVGARRFDERSCVANEGNDELRCK